MLNALDLFNHNTTMMDTLQVVIEFIGTFAFAISGIRQAAAKKFDWFGGFVCGFAVAIGGGTLQGLARVMLKTDDIKQISLLAAEGDISNVNVLIGDISPHALPGLPKSATASLFGKTKSNASREDIALGITWMVIQAIGSSTILSSLGSGIKDYVLIGNLTLLPQCKEVYTSMEKLYNVRFHIPKHSEFCTAIGAALQAPELTIEK